jgi:hypothetical protein
MLNDASWLHHCGNMESLSVLLQQFEVDSLDGDRTALFGRARNYNLSAHQHRRLTHALLDAGADPHLLVGQRYLPRVAALEAVFERVTPQSLFPTAADLLCPEPHLFDCADLVLLLVKHGYTVSEVRCTLVFASSTQVCVRQQECLVKLQAPDNVRDVLPSRWVMWYALLLHRLIDAIPPGLVEHVQSLVRWGMEDEDGPVYSRVAWLPHTHHLFPDRFKVSVCVETYSMLTVMTRVAWLRFCCA